MTSFQHLLSADIRDVLILQTTDIHSHIFSDESGWLRAAGLIKKLRKKAGGQDNSILIDCGDTLVGSLSSLVSNAKASADMLNELEYDIWVPGNHDFEIGTEKLLEISRYIKADKLAGNLQWHNKIFKKWALYRKNGASIAVIGLTSPYLNEWLWGEDVADFHVISLMKAVDSIIPDIMIAKPDMIILAIHHGRFSPRRLKGVNISKITEKYPQIDLVLGGHSHLEVPGEKNGISSWYVLCGAHAEKIAEIHAKIDITKGKVVEITSNLIPITSKLQPDPVCFYKLKDVYKRKLCFENQIVTPASLYISSKISGKEIDRIFGKALCVASGASAAFISHPLSFDISMLENGITEKELFELEPYEDRVCTLLLNRKQILDILSEQTKTANKIRKQALFGLEVRKNKHGFRCIYLDGSDKPMGNNRKVSIAFSSYVLAGGGGRFPVLKSIAERSECQGKSMEMTVRQALRLCLKRISVPTK